MLSIIIDITDAKTKSKELEKTQYKLLLSQKTTGVGFIFWNLTTNRVEISKETAKIFGVDESTTELSGDFINKSVYPDDVELVTNGLQSAIKNNSTYNIEHRIINRLTNEIVWIKAQAELVFDKKGAPIELTGTLVNITTLKKHEQNLSISMLEGEEKEKTRIAQELHDGIAQYLAAINMNLIGMEDSINEDVIEIYHKTQKLVSQTLNETRNISHNLIPKEMDLGLEIALNHLIEKQKKFSEFNISLIITGDVSTLSQFVNFNLYRITQEFINNTHKYANAKTIKIEISLNNNLLSYLIQDDGLGFDIESNEFANGIGLSNMEHRANAINASFKLSSSPNKGTSIQLFLNFNEI